MVDKPLNRAKSPGASDAGTAIRQRDSVIRMASVNLFFNHGFNAVGIRQIAEAVSINSATLYHYYPSKRAILESIMEDSNELILEDAVSALASAPSPRHRFAYLAGALVAAQVSSPKTCYILDNELRAIDRTGSTGRRILQLRRDYEELWHDELCDAVSRGDFSCQDGHVVRLSLLGMYSSASLWYRPNDTYKASDICSHLVDLGLRMVDGDPLTDDDRIALVRALKFSSWPWEPPEDQVLTELPSFADLQTS